MAPCDRPGREAPAVSEMKVEHASLFQTTNSGMVHTRGGKVAAWLDWGVEATRGF